MKTIEVDGKVFEAEPAPDYYNEIATCIGCDFVNLPVVVGCRGKDPGYPYCEDNSIVWVEKK